MLIELIISLTVGHINQALSGKSNRAMVPQVLEYELPGADRLLNCSSIHELLFVHVQIYVFKKCLAEASQILELRALLLRELLQFLHEMTNKGNASSILHLIVKIVVAAVHNLKGLDAVVLECHRQWASVHRVEQGIVSRVQNDFQHFFKVPTISVAFILDAEM